MTTSQLHELKFISTTTSSSLKPGNSKRMKAALTALSVAGGSATALVTTISAVVGYRAVKPQRRKMSEIPEGFLLPPEKVSFKSTDGLNLSGYFYPSGTGGETVITCHGFHGASVDVHEPAIALQRSGYNVLTFDFRGCGESAGHTTSVGYYEVRDLLGAVEFVKRRPEVDPEAIGVFGFSMGGATAILAAALTTDIKVLVTDSAFASLENVLSVNFRYFYRLPPFPFRRTAVLASKFFSGTVNKDVFPLKALHKLREDSRNLPFFIIHGEKDGLVPVSEAHLLYQNYSDTKEFWISSESGHIVGMHVNRDEYTHRVTGFLDRYLKQDTRTAA